MAITNRILLFVFSMGVFFIPVLAHAQLGLGEDSNKTPVAIEADQAIEWLRDEKQYIAKGNALATQGDYTVQADRLIADYRDLEDGSTQVWQFTADGNVIISSSTYKAYGEKAIYDVLDEKTTLIGPEPKITSQKSEIRAHQSIEFFSKENKVIAKGRPQAVQDNKKIDADLMTGYFKKDAKGNLTLDKVIAEGHIKIVSASEVLFGDKAVYHINDGKATVTGNVRITRGQNQLNGSKAVFDVKKGISTLYGDTKNTSNTGQTRVRGLFYLGDNKNNTQQP